MCKAMETAEKIKELYWGQQLSLREAAEVLGVPYPTLQSWFKKLAIPYRDKCSAQALFIKKHPEILEKRRISGRNQVHGKQSPETVAKRFAWYKDYEISDETRAKMSKALKGRKWTKEQRERQLPIFFANCHQRPTKIERQFQDIVSRNNLPYKYVGDGYTWIAGRCPDFLNINGQKTVVEVFSRWWHDLSVNKRIKPQHTEEATLKHYRDYGFDCIIIWEEELANEEAVLAKLQSKGK